MSHDVRSLETVECTDKLTRRSRIILVNHTHRQIHCLACTQHRCHKEDDSDGYHNHTEDVDGVLENQDTALATRNVYDSRKLVHFNPLQ